MRFTHPPLETNHIVQPFGRNWAPDNLYNKLGMLGHNGLDYRSENGTSVYAVASGILEYEFESPGSYPPGFSPARGYGVNARLWIDLDESNKLEVIYGHLQEITAPRGQVVGGQRIALSDTTGLATGPHLHLGVRRWRVTDPQKGTRQVLDYQNGYFGWIDPAPFLAETHEFPVDIRYGQPRSLARELLFAPSKLWFKRKTGRLPEVREELAFVYGYWPYEAVVDPAMYVVWRELTFPAYAKLLKQPPEVIAKGLRGY